MEKIDKSEEYKEFEKEYYDLLSKMIDIGKLGENLVYLDSNILLYGKKELNKVKKTKLGKLII